MCVSQGFFQTKRNYIPTRLILRYATPQKMNPKNESKSEDIKLSKSLKKGMTSAMMKANTQVTARIPAQLAQPRTVLDPLIGRY